ncbi:MarR family transcriptional regulator [Nonomuraea sp. PA05]|uniref:MarR family transcriptional regulator n=1 Tax=Nonomuraea sp. PA05 TaxID=2604466 RepID=UPI0021CC7A1A|nr:MarR family transcriptional regulator [Nonomuraea sp. PA05]
MTQRDRHRIAAGLADRLPYAEIARRLDRPTSTVSREIARNGGPTGYRPEQAHRATERRARRGTPALAPGAAAPYGELSVTLDETIEMAVRMGLPKMMARVLIGLWLSEEGRLTAAELTRRLKVSPASVSLAVGYLAQQGLIRRERDPHRRRDIYVVDDDAWYHSIVVSARQTVEVAAMAVAAARALGPDSAVGGRLGRGGAYLERIAQDTMESAERWRGLLNTQER